MPPPSSPGPDTAAPAADLAVGAAVAGAVSPLPSATGPASAGLWLMVLSALGFSGMSLFVKLAAHTLPTMEIVFARSVLMAAVTYGLLHRRGLPARGVNRPLLFARAAIGSTALSLLYFALGRLPLGDATTIHYTAPIWTALTASLLLGERVGPRVAGSIALSLAGVLLVARPSFLFGTDGALEGIGVLAAVGGSVLSGIAYTLVRRLRTTDAPLVIVFWLSAVGALGAFPFALGGWAMPDAQTWAYLAAAGGMTLVGQVALTYGLHRLPAGRATAVGYVQILFAFAWSMLVFDVHPDAGSILGALVVLTGVLLVGAPPASLFLRRRLSRLQRRS
ncbi:MAG TPA: DMT family transporter [Rhodothermales bacterium]|nr:DMT family transporter [Rhodothermales bacterium]